jgi:MoaA/NifB/PqqE/SkfB family radical SAM enzyme
VVEAGPHRTEEINIDEACNWIDQIAKYRNGYIRAISLTGGEPFYCYEKLIAIARHGAELGMIITTITNGFWAKSLSAATRTLQKVEGLKMIGISADPHHQNFIPFERVKNAILAAKKCNIPYKIIVTSENDNYQESVDFLARIEEISPKENIQHVNTFPAGRASNTIKISQDFTSEVPCQGQCEAAGAPVIFPDGRIIACIGALVALKCQHPLDLGNIRNNSLADILDKSEGNPILHGLRIWGPERLVSIVKGTFGDSIFSERFIKDVICDPCYKIMSNRKLMAFVEQLANDPEYIRTVAYGRYYHLNEIEMLDYLKNKNIPFL